MGFIGYRVKKESGAAAEIDQVVRIFLECKDSLNGEDRFQVPPDAPPTDVPPGITYTFAVDVVFPGGKAPCHFIGVDQVLVLKKFYKLVHSLEERAREHGNPREKILESAEGLLEHLRYTRNARDFTGFQNSA